MTFLQRVLNGGCRIEREYVAGRGRMDLTVEYNKRTYIIEIKLIRSYNAPEEVLKEGIAQIIKYRNTIDIGAPAYLMIFDRRDTAKDIPWDEKIYRQEETVIGC